MTSVEVSAVCTVIGSKLHQTLKQNLYKTAVHIEQRIKLRSSAVSQPWLHWPCRTPGWNHWTNHCPFLFCSDGIW